MKIQAQRPAPAAAIVIDAVPESYPYRDDGCEIAPSCLRCPLPQCKYDDPGWLRRQQRDQRDREVLTEILERRLSVAQVSARFALSQRTVFRILKRADQNGVVGAVDRRVQCLSILG